MKAIPSGEKYEGVPQALEPRDRNYIQPWSGYCPDSTAKNLAERKSLDCQTFNIKGSGIYKGIEVKGNKWIEMACEEGRKSAETLRCPFGAVMVQIDDETGEVIRYWRNHSHDSEWNDPTAHAELTAVRAACQELGVRDLGVINRDDPALKLAQKGKTSHCEVYASAEPCPMCYSAMRWAHINTIVFAATRFDFAVQGANFSDEDLRIELMTPYSERNKLGVRVYQSTVPNSLDSFNAYKRLGN